MHINEDGIRILDYVTILGNPRILSPAEKAELDAILRQMREIVSAHKVTIITAKRHVRKEEDWP